MKAMTQLAEHQASLLEKLRYVHDVQKTSFLVQCMQRTDPV